MGKHFTLTARTNTVSGPIAPIRRARQRAASSSFRRFSASTITSAKSATTSPRKATSRWRRRCSTAAEGLPVRLHAAGDREVPHLRRQARLGRDAARHRRGDQGDRFVGPVAHHRLLHGRHDRVPRRDAAVGPERGGGLLRRPDRRSSPTRSRSARRRCISARRTHGIPMSDVEIIKQKRGGDSEIYVYADAGHGFHCDERGSFHKGSADVAYERTGVPRQAHEEIRQGELSHWSRGGTESSTACGPVHQERGLEKL